MKLKTAIHGLNSILDYEQGEDLEIVIQFPNGTELSLEQISNETDMSGFHRVVLKYHRLIH